MAVVFGPHSEMVTILSTMASGETSTFPLYNYICFLLSKHSLPKVSTVLEHISDPNTSPCMTILSMVFLFDNPLGVFTAMLNKFPDSYRRGSILSLTPPSKKSLRHSSNHKASKHCLKSKTCKSTGFFWQ